MSFKTFYLTVAPALLALLLAGNSAQGADVAVPEVKKPQWSQSASLGFTLNKGNTDSLLFTADYRAGLKLKRDEFALGVDASYGKDNGRKNNEQLRGFGQYNWLFGERLYGFIRLEALHDDVADVNYRVTISPGAGYYFIKNGKTLLSAEVGPGYVREDVGGRDRGFGTLRAGEKFEHKFDNKTRVWQTLEILPQVDRFSNYLLTFEAGLETALTKTVSLRVTGRDTYDNEPAPGRKCNDFRLVTSIAVKF